MSNTPDTNTQFSDTHHVHVGPILGVLAIILVLILGGLYIWGSMITPEKTEPVTRTIPNNEPETPRAVADQQILGTVSPSDDLDAISADLESTTLDSIDTDLGSVETEMNASLE